jgi:hypothetical protein
MGGRTGNWVALGAATVLIPASAIATPAFGPSRTTCPLAAAQTANVDCILQRLTVGTIVADQIWDVDLSRS